MKFLFQTRLLLWTIGGLLLVLYLQREMHTGVSHRLGGPVEIAYDQGHTYRLLLLWLRFLMVGFAVPFSIGLLVYGYLRRLRPTGSGRLGRVLLLSTLMAWAWGLLGAVGLAVVPSYLKPYYALAMFLLEISFTIAAAGVGYNEGPSKTPSIP